MPTFAYDTAPVKEFKVIETNDKGNVTAMEINGRKVQPTERFWTSLCATFSTVGLSKKLFGMFSHEEVFNRLSERFSDNLRYTVSEYDGGGKGYDRLLAATKPDKPLAKYDSVMNMLEKYEAQDVSYSDGNSSGSCGIVQSWHVPCRMENIQIGGDNFIPKFVMETPIDGFGSPLIYLSMLREICTNGMVGYSRAFRSELALGKGEDVMFSLERALDSYSNEEGYMALRSRLESATNSWASINEASKIAKALTGIGFKQKGDGSDEIERLAATRLPGGDGGSMEDSLSFKIQKAFTGVTGDLCHVYGLVHLDALSRKKMAALPTRATVYDLMNFGTEVATHYCGSDGARKLQAVVGGLLGDGEYDLEGSKLEMKSFADWHIATSDEAKSFRQNREQIHKDLQN